MYNMYKLLYMSSLSIKLVDFVWYRTRRSMALYCLTVA